MWRESGKGLENQNCNFSHWMEFLMGTGGVSDEFDNFVFSKFLSKY